LLRQRDLLALSQRCDNWLKYILVERHRGRKGLLWSSPELKVLDLIYPSLDESESLFFSMARAGSVERMPTKEELDCALREPPVDTRAYLRAQALRRFGEHVDSLDWAYIRFSIPQGRWWSSVARLSMPDPGGYGREVVEEILGSCQELDEFVETINGLAPQREVESRALPTLTAWGEAPGKTAFSANAIGYGTNGSNS
jgi:proteasome accessory factor A